MNELARPTPAAASKILNPIRGGSTPDCTIGDTPIADLLQPIDRMIAAATAPATSGLSPVALYLAFSDWAVHLASVPGKQTELALKGWRDWQSFCAHFLQSTVEPNAEPYINPLPGDNRFKDEAWQRLPYRFWYQNFLLTEQFWLNATNSVDGVSPHHRDVVSFVARQWLDMVSPSNLSSTNPVVAEETLRTGGQNLVAGLRNWLEDIARTRAGQPPVGAEAFKVGQNVASTPGKVIFRNHLIELIQYTAVTETVHPEPVLIVPAWIMKYYILDLSPHNSLIRHLVQNGHTVFCISWRNVTAVDRDISLEDYRRLGIMTALDAIGSIVPGQKVHATGYCLGGTLLTLAAAAMAEIGDNRFKTMTLLAAQTDFTEPGELQIFIDDSQVAFLEDIMSERGTLDGTQMAGAFQMLRSNDLIWSRLIHEYMMGQRTPMNDLMAWNADVTRMPYRMHSEYLRKFFLGNDLATGRYLVEGRPIAIQNIRVPIFAVGTERDHVAPWHSVYKINYLSDTEVTFVLTSGGHNAGIVSEPGHPHRHFRIATRPAADRCLSADEWQASTSPQEGSWWLDWLDWLDQRSPSERIPPPSMSEPSKGLAPLCDAPGTYVLQS
jgi:polyhydroxyalkanoate synthase